MGQWLSKWIRGSLSARHWFAHSVQPWRPAAYLLRLRRQGEPVSYGVDRKNGYGFEFAELAQGGDQLLPVNLNQSFRNGGSVEWDGKYVAVGDDTAQKIYRFAISGASGALKGTVNLGSAQSVHQFRIQGKRVVGADDLPNTVWYWKYPAGAMPIKFITKMSSIRLARRSAGFRNSFSVRSRPNPIDSTGWTDLSWHSSHSSDNSFGDQLLPIPNR